MTDPVFCYHCRRYHPINEMTQVSSKGITRWRCRKSIVSSKNSQVQRDAFGKRVSELNKVDNPRSLPHCVREVFGYAGRGFVSAA